MRAGGASDKAGVREGDVIIKVNGQQVTESLHSEVVKLIQLGETSRTSDDDDDDDDDDDVLQVPMSPSRWFTVVGLPDCSRSMEEEEEERVVAAGERASRALHLPTTRRSGGSTPTKSTPSSS